MTAEAEATTTQNLSYYSEMREGGRNIFEIWEEHLPYNDSVTPSIWSIEYREWISHKVRSLCGHDFSKRILSIGCGNAFVEADLCTAGYSVSAVDAMPEAVAMARLKGVDARICDFWDCHTVFPDGFDLVYADGLLGHLLDAHSLLDVLKAFRRLLTPGGLLLLSNDSAGNGSIESHPTVPNFSYVHHDQMVAAGLAAGLLNDCVMSFPYSRPLTGQRWRAVAVLREP
ncbi:MAG: class I SAM-dependent methyltransferase [Phenylobacterium sp.]|uniref:class I SAM-dependent methyltransferase n=1 Tax=Phenylobacterium sp. TaxID=1871053 RepID=UPI00273665CA|nr:class I SAM-dependent methyltransferase [Phenylobacterium sp.]MDP3745631.1 class I SAM-dependent methyltransferase [Phenylobacterium sp.]